MVFMLDLLGRHFTSLLSCGICLIAKLSPAPGYELVGCYRDDNTEEWGFGVEVMVMATWWQQRIISNITPTGAETGFTRQAYRRIKRNPIPQVY